MVKEKSYKWELKDLPPLMSGDHLAFEAVSWEKIIGLAGGKSFHWGLIGDKVCDDNEISKGDYSIFDSTSKGITAHLLSQYLSSNVRIYRPVIKNNANIQEFLSLELQKRMLWYGDQKYDWKGVILTGIWMLIHKINPKSKLEWWVHNSSKFWCIEFNNIVWRDLSVKYNLFPDTIGIVPDAEPPNPVNFENSKNLKLIWGTY